MPYMAKLHTQITETKIPTACRHSKGHKNGCKFALYKAPEKYNTAETIVKQKRRFTSVNSLSKVVFIGLCLND